MSAPSETEVIAADVHAILRTRGIDEGIHDAILKSLPRRAIGVVLYGSQARGDATPDSDVDLLLVGALHAPARSEGSVNVATYDFDQLSSARGTLFGMHLARDGIVLHDAGRVWKTVAGFGPIDEDKLWERLASLASLLRLPADEQLANLPGFVRHARYVLRSATYAQAIRDGEPCFSVSELSERFNDPELKVLLSSHPEVQGPPSLEVLESLRRRVAIAVPEVEDPEYLSLADLIVGEQLRRPELADSAVLILGPRGDGPYAEIPRVIL